MEEVRGLSPLSSAEHAPNGPDVMRALLHAFAVTGVDVSGRAKADGGMPKS